MKNNAFLTLNKAILALSFGILASNAVADSYEDGLVAFADGHYAEAGRYLMASAEQGNAGAEQMLMRLYSEGKLQASNADQEVLKWTKKAAHNGIKQAQFALADIYANKLGKYKKAVKWYRLAAKQGHPVAYYRLGEIFKNGAGEVKADSKKSNHLYQIAASELTVFAQKGDPKQQYLLGDMYQNAKGVKKNMKLALKWMGESAIHGNALAQYKLGSIYAMGEDVDKDLNKAKYWLNMAAAQGFGSAIAMLEKMKRKSHAEVALVNS
jgi:TPR repeat protein